MSEGVQSLDRAFELLERMADAGQPIGLSELALQTGLPLPTIHRLVRSLARSGYVRQDHARRYALGLRLIRLGEAAGRGLGDWARPQLATLVSQIGETANLALLDGDAAVYVAQAPSPHAMRMFTEVGRRVPLHCTGVGKALLSVLTDDAAAALVARTGLAAQTERTLTTTEALVAELKRIRRRGYAIDDGEQEVGVRCVAVPVGGAHVPAAISVSGPSSRLPNDRLREIAPIVQQAAEGLTAASAM